MRQNSLLVQFRRKIADSAGNLSAVSAHLVLSSIDVYLTVFIIFNVVSPRLWFNARFCLCIPCLLTNRVYPVPSDLSFLAQCRSSFTVCFHH